jgi:hypothetical protein
MTLHLTLSVQKPSVSTLYELRLTARFENRGKKPLSAVIDATPLSHGDYSVEFQDAEGRPVDLDGFGMCGTMAPLVDHEVFLVEPGSTADILVHPGRGTLGAGAYRVRVSYHAYRNDHGKDSWTPVVKERLKHFWTGDLISDWVPFTIQ